MNPEDQERKELSWFIGIIVALILLAISYMIFAQPVQANVHHWLPRNIERPPAQYRHDPDQGYRIKHVTQRGLKDKCPSRHAIVACWHPLYGTIFVIRGLREETEAAVIEHEKAHINGWRH